MLVEENMALARRFMEAIIKADLDTVDELLAPTTLATPKSFPTKSPALKAKNGRSPKSLPLSPTQTYASRTR